MTRRTCEIAIADALFEIGVAGRALTQGGETLQRRGRGFVFMSDSRISIVLGYRLQYLSNGNAAAENPSVDFRSIVLGIRSRR